MTWPFLYSLRLDSAESRTTQTPGAGFCSDDHGIFQDDLPPRRVSTILRPGMPVADLAARLAAIADQSADMAAVAVTLTPVDLIRISRLIQPVGGGWPNVEAPAPRGPFVLGVAVGLFAAGLLLFLRSVVGP